MTEKPERLGPIYTFAGDIEDPEWYKKSGFHPVHIEELHHSRYRVVHKLGYGSYSTVWLV